MTPGEEYFRIFPLENTSIPSRLSLFVRIFYEICLPHLIKNDLPSLFRCKWNGRMQKICLKLLESLHRSVFLIQGKFPTVAHRLSSQSYVAMRRPLTEGEESGLVKKIGLVSFFLGIMNFYWELKEQRLLQLTNINENNPTPKEQNLHLGPIIESNQNLSSNVQNLQNNNLKTNPQTSSLSERNPTINNQILFLTENTQNTTNTTRFRCILCLELVHEQIVTECGHVFCWRCIVGWLDEEGKVMSTIC